MNILLILHDIVVYTTLFFIAKGDLRSRIIDGRLMFVLVAAWLTRVWVEGVPPLEVLISVGAAGFLYLSLLAVTLMYEKIRGRYGMGGGDLKLFAVSALLVGPSYILPVVFVSSFLGLVIYSVRPWAEGYFPFGPAIVVATCLFLVTI